MKRYRVLERIEVDGVLHQPRAVVELDEQRAQELLARGVIELAPEADPQ